LKPKIDTKSLKFKLWLTFLLFAGILMLLLWVLQVFFLNNYYQEMKTRETANTANKIANLYKSGDRTGIRDEIRSIYRANDMYIEIETESGIPIYIPNINLDAEETGTTTPHLPPSVYQGEISAIKAELEESGQISFSKKVTDPSTGLITLEYAAYLESEGEDRNLLFIFSPLYPMESTIDILANQLVYITIISMAMTFLLALYLARKVTQPLSRITESAARLGEGNYGIVFEGAHYTEIIDLADTLTFTSLELARSDNMQKDIIANVSHDLRTPLTMVISYAEMIRDLSGGDPEKRNEHLQVIIDEAGRLNSLVSDLLEVSRMHSGDRSITLSEFSMKACIESQLQSYAGFVEQEGFKLVFMSRGDGIIHADEARIKQVIGNLVSNAFKYSGRDKTVDVKMYDEGYYVRVEISDHGIGIPKKDLRHIWERYYKASSNYQRSNSTGLGLSIVKEILLLHGANFGVESALRKGSTFWFEIKKPDPASVLPETTRPTEDEMKKLSITPKFKESIHA
jgi:signal transduction histidine kinase